MTVKVTYNLRISHRHIPQESHMMHQRMEQQYDDFREEKIREWEKQNPGLDSKDFQYHLHRPESRHEYWLPDVCHKVIIEGKDFADCDEQMKEYTRAFREKETAQEREEKNFVDKVSFDYTYEVVPSGCKNE